MKNSRAIFGPPGCGKTHALVRSVADLVRAGRGPDMAVMSFSRAGARELVRRIPQADRPRFVGTMHAWAFERLGLSRSSVARIEDFESFCNVDPLVVGDAVETGCAGRRTMTTLADAYDRGGHLESFEKVRYYYDMYTLWKADHGLVDFDDMMDRATKSMGSSGAERYGVVVVDEAQDLSRAQWRLVEALVSRAGTLICAGDDDQAIYEWNGAWPGGMAAQCTDHEVLGQSYRVPLEVYRAAMRTAAMIRDRKDKRFLARAAKGYIAVENEYNPLNHDRPHAVLCRDRYAMRDVEAVLQQEALPYRMEGAHGRGWFEDRFANAARALKTRVGAPQKWAGCMKPYPGDLMKDGQWPDKAEAGAWHTLAPDEQVHYLERVNLFEEPRITLSTIHAQKGREHDHVVVVGDQSVASSLAPPDAEARVWYTALTRAREGVTIVRPNNYTRV